MENLTLKKLPFWLTGKAFIMFAVLSWLMERILLTTALKLHFAELAILSFLLNAIIRILIIGLVIYILLNAKKYSSRPSYILCGLAVIWCLLILSFTLYTFLGKK